MQLRCLRLDETSQAGRRLYKQIMAFFMSRLIKLATQHCLETDLLHALNTKLSRRLHKLGDTVESTLFNPIETVAKDCRGIMSRRWKLIQQDKTWRPNIDAFSNLDFE